MILKVAINEKLSPIFPVPFLTFNLKLNISLMSEHCSLLNNLAMFRFAF